MEYFSRYQLNQIYPKSEFTSFSRDSASSSQHSVSPGATALPKKRRKDDRYEVRAKIQKGSVQLIGCTSETDILQHVVENGVKIAFYCNVCKAIFSPNTGGYLKTHRNKCLKNIHLDKANPHELSEVERNEFTKLIIESMTRDGQTSEYFNSENFISLLQYIHDLGFQYGLENAQSSKSGTPFGPADISATIPHHLELDRIVKSCVDEKRTKFYELIKDSIDGNGGGFVVDAIFTKFVGFVFHFITNDWEYVCAPIAIDDTKNNTVSAKAYSILQEYNLDKRDISFVCNKDGSVFQFLKNSTPLISATHWIQKVFEQICENPKPISNISAKLQNSLNELFQLVEDAKTIVKCVEKDALYSSSYNNAEFEYDNCHGISEGFQNNVHRFMSYSDEDIETIRNHFLTQENKTMSKMVENLYRNRLKLDVFVKIFQPFLDGIQCLSDDKSPTLHLVPGILYNYCQMLKTNKHANQLENVLAEIISTAIESQMNSLLSEFHYFALILDPKRKNCMKDYLSKEEFLQKIKDFEKLVSEIDEPSDPSSCSEFNPYEASDEPSNSYKTELTLYYRTNVVCEERDYDILQWWRENTFQFPRLSKLARKYLSIPASSVSAEKIFNLTLDEKNCSDVEALSNIVLYRTIEKLGL